QQGTTKGGVENPPKEEKPDRSVMGKSRFVLPDRSKPLQTPAIQTDIEKNEEKSYIFAAGTENRKQVAIPSNELDEAFGKDSNPEIIPDYSDIEIDDDDDNGDIDFEAEEAEELGRVEGSGAMYADGYDFNDLQTVAKAVREQPETVDGQTGKTLVALEHTELLILLAEGDEGKANWTRAIIDRQVQRKMSEMETKTEVSTNTDYGDFEAADYFS
ncbi:MAG: hypothetical protein LBH61_06770, partial [Dysgonamonadaceae bacterium]|nr:hypothetical protein [Dysgonamonadaceae bacterium]